MDIRFYIDPETNQPHIEEHGVTEDRAGSEESRVSIGQTSAGRYLKVIYARDPVGDSVFVITAYDLTGKALQAYRRRQRRRKGR
jgi:hypothetical protein